MQLAAVSSRSGASEKRIVQRTMRFCKFRFNRFGLRREGANVTAPSPVDYSRECVELLPTSRMNCRRVGGSIAAPAAVRTGSPQIQVFLVLRIWFPVFVPAAWSGFQCPSCQSP